MKQLSFLILLFAGVSVFGQKPNTETLTKALQDFDKGLVNKDSLTIKSLTTDHLSYGHSNGWIEDKKDIIADLYNGKLNYKKITEVAPRAVIVEGNAASVRLTEEIDVDFNGAPIHLKLNILQLWIWKNKQWQLMARQSVKI